MDLNSPNQVADDNAKDPKEVSPSVTSSVKIWTDRIRKARDHWKADFERMRSNMDFAASFQWPEQSKMDDDRYIANMTLKLVSQKVSMLYAKNPKVTAERRSRMDFQIWDGKVESLQQAAAITSSPEADPMHQMGAMALISDYTRGRQTRDLLDKIGKTMENVFNFMLTDTSPGFKIQMKQLVRQTVITGVGYVKLDFARGYESPLTSTATNLGLEDRMKMAESIMTRLKNGEITEDSPEMETLTSIFQTMQAYQDEQNPPQERLIFDFPTPTAIIPDTRCRSLKGFVGAHWIAQEFILPIAEVNAHFGITVSIGAGNVVEYNTRAQQTETQTLSTNVIYNREQQDLIQNRCCLWQVFDLDTKTHFYIVDGYKDFVQEPAPVYPETKHFWPVFALTFNDVVVEEGQRATIFPPSDVQLVAAPQKDWNRSRQSLRQQRSANAPKYMTGKGWLTDNDKESIINCIPNSIVELEGANPNDDINKKLAPFQPAPIDPALYDTGPQTQDIFATFGNEQNSAPASTSGDATATAATINEQSRITVTASNIDDLDDFLCEIAESGGEILLRECSTETVQRIAGPGAVWPDVNKEEFIQMVFLKVEASSSGRPNKALAIANFQQLAPIMLQAGANPQFIVREAAKRLDDNINLDEAFSLGAPSIAMAPGQQGQGSGEPMRGANAPSQANKFPAATQPQVPNIQQPKLGVRNG